MKYRFGLHGSLKALPGKGAELGSILMEAAQVLEAIKGCHLYLISIDAENVDKVWVTEVWETREDHAASLQMDQIRELIGKAMPILDGMPSKGTSLNVLGGSGLST